MKTWANNQKARGGRGLRKVALFFFADAVLFFCAAWAAFNFGSLVLEFVFGAVCIVNVLAALDCNYIAREADRDYNGI